jgi:CheY-like chemotaxis protein
MDPQGPVLLLVEDNDDDVFLMQRAIRASKLSVRLQVATNGQEALDYLAGDGKYNDRAQYPLPAVVLLDLKLPYVHGFEVLGWIRQQSALSETNVVVLTSSPEDRDQKKAKELGAKAYLVKPPTGDMLLQLLQPTQEPNPIPTQTNQPIVPPPAA